MPEKFVFARIEILNAILKSRLNEKTLTQDNDSFVTEATPEVDKMKSERDSNQLLVRRNPFWYTICCLEICQNHIYHLMCAKIWINESFWTFIYCNIIFFPISLIILLKIFFCPSYKWLSVMVFIVFWFSSKLWGLFLYCPRFLSERLKFPVLYWLINTIFHLDFI